MTVIGLALSLLAVAPPPPALSGVTVKELSHGIYRETRDPDAPLPLDLDKETDTVEACLGVEFGYQLVIGGLDPGSTFTFRKVVRHPPIHMPDGTTSRGYEKNTTTLAREEGTVVTHQGFGIDHYYEEAPGRWEFEFWSGGKKLASRAFTLTKCQAKEPDPSR
jgi:hypothetical protein